MILGLGTDLTTISRIAKLHKETGARFLERILSADEYMLAVEKEGDALHRWLAKRFAGKEAIAKALGTGIGSHALFTEISITNDDAGKPIATLSGSAAERLASLHPAATVHLSLSDEGDLAMAFAVISCP